MMGVQPGPAPSTFIHSSFITVLDPFEMTAMSIADLKRFRRRHGRAGARTRRTISPLSLFWMCEKDGACKSGTMLRHSN